MQAVEESEEEEEEEEDDYDERRRRQSEALRAANPGVRSYYTTTEDRLRTEIHTLRRIKNTPHLSLSFSLLKLNTNIYEGKKRMNHCAADLGVTPAFVLPRFHTLQQLRVSRVSVDARAFAHIRLFPHLLFPVCFSSLFPLLPHLCAQVPGSGFNS